MSSSGTRVRLEPNSIESFSDIKDGLGPVVPDVIAQRTYHIDGRCNVQRGAWQYVAGVHGRREQVRSGRCGRSGRSWPPVSHSGVGVLVRWRRRAASVTTGCQRSSSDSGSSSRSVGRVKTVSSRNEKDSDD